MASCKDCVHFEVCDGGSSGDEFMESGTYTDGVENDCKTFKERSKFVELPCKVGDTVYEVVTQDDSVKKIIEMKVGNIVPFGSIYHSKICGNFIWNLYLHDDYSYSYKTFSDIGETVFLTREEAEQALREME